MTSMNEQVRSIYSVVLTSLALSLSAIASEQNDEDIDIEEIIVLAQSEVASLDMRSELGSVSSLSSEIIERTRPAHPHELFVRIPGVWVTKNSGQEHLTAVRSAVLAGPGACGAVLLLENNLPVRPAGFCNVNGLFEINMEQAARVEVLRGPASPLLGSNALYGAINVNPFGANTDLGGSIELGPNNARQGRFEGQVGPLLAKFVDSATDGYRDSTGHEQRKLNIASRSSLAGWNSETTFSATALDQQTGGYVRGFEAYRDEELRFTNPNPNAYRQANSTRVASHWFRSHEAGELYVAPYARRSNMTFLQHFLPGQPLEKNDQSSVGVVVVESRDFARGSVSFGAQLESMSASLYQHQSDPTTGSAFLQATRPMGTHYRYNVHSTSIAGFVNASLNLAVKTTLAPSLRVERIDYEYDNLHLDGNTKDDGTVCGFGGCLYTRPADRNDKFDQAVARIGIRHMLTEESTVWVVAGRGFRPPQTTELYRLQNGQEIADLGNEKLTSFEAGVRFDSDFLQIASSLFLQRADDVIFRDAEGFNVSDGETEGRGVEVECQFTIEEVGRLTFAGTFANHEYAFTRNAARGESIVSGNQIDSAPSALASVQWSRSFGDHSDVELEIARVGAHYLNAANTARYGGHTLANLRANHRLSSNWTAFWRAMNLFDARYSDRADFAFGSYRYFPGDARRLFVGIEFRQ